MLELLLPLIGGLGIGSVITKVIDNWLSNKKSVESRMYQEKREVYLGLLESLHRVINQPSKETAINFDLWLARVELFGAPAVAKAVKDIMVMHDEESMGERNKYYEKMKEEMRNDLIT